MKRNIFKYSVLFIAPALFMSTIAITGASWKDSIKDDSISVERETYTINFIDNGNAYGDPYEGLELTSGFELPIIAVEGFEGWTLTGSETIYIGYHTLIEFSDNISGTTLTMHAKYSA